MNDADVNAAEKPVEAVPVPPAPAPLPMATDHQYPSLGAVKCLSALQIILYVPHLFLGYYWISWIGLMTGIIGAYATGRLVRPGSVKAYWIMNVVTIFAEIVQVVIFVYVKIIRNDFLHDSTLVKNTFAFIVVVSIILSAVCFFISVTGFAMGHKLAKELKANPECNIRNGCCLQEQKDCQHQQEVIAALGKDCQELKWQKARLEEKKALASSKIITRQSNFHDKAYSTALNYFQTMMHGISLTNCDRRESQIEFLRSAFREDLLLEGGFAGSHGVNGLIDQFVKYTKFHKSFHMAVSNFTVCGDNTLAVVRNQVNTTLVISRDSIAGIYPHVMSDEVLVQRIIGKEIVVYGTTIFYCNDKGQIEKFDCTIDYVGAWAKLLGDVDTAINLLDEANISGSLIEPVEEIQ